MVNRKNQAGRNQARKNIGARLRVTSRKTLLVRRASPNRISPKRGGR